MNSKFLPAKFFGIITVLIYLMIMGELEILTTTSSEKCDYSRLQELFIYLVMGIIATYWCYRLEIKSLERKQQED